MEIDKKLIPPGGYCYEFVPHTVSGKNIVNCPYYEYHPEQLEHQTGYCKYLKLGDWEENGTNLLWDGVKECRENRECRG